MKKAIIILSSIVFVVIGFFAFIIVSDFKEASEIREKKLQQEKALIGEQAIKEKSESNGEEEILDLLDLKLHKNMTTNDILDIVHQMSHQKVDATDKWGAIPMTSGNIEQLNVFLKQDDLNIEYLEDLRKISERWSDGDFSKADEDHNFVWRIQDGYYGEASGVASEQTEIDFIRTTFGDKFYNYLIKIGELQE